MSTFWCISIIHNMIITKSPYRISLGGGACDFEDYFSIYGPVISTGFSFQKHCYVTIMHLPENGLNYQIGYSSFERVQTISEIKNPAIRGTLEYMNDPKLVKLGINIINELNPKTGIGSSSSLICSLVRGLYQYLGYNIQKKELASLAIAIERKHLNEYGGWNDQIFSAFGGFNCITYYKDSTFKVVPLRISLDFIDYFTKSCVLYYTNKNNMRNSWEVSKTYHNPNILEYKHKLSYLSNEIKTAIEQENIELVGKLIHLSWETKKNLSKLISNESIDLIYTKIIKSGALGGRLMGSGISGFIFTIYPSPDVKNKAVQELNIPYINIVPDFNGTTLVFSEK